MNNKKALIIRAYIIGAILILFGLGVFYKLIRVQYIETYQGKKWGEYAQVNEERIDTIPATRGNIYSKDSSLLATSLPYYFIGIDTRTASNDYFETHVEELARLMAEKFNEKPASYYVQRLTRSRNKETSRYVRLRSKDITHLERNEVLKWPFFRRGDKGGGGGKFESFYKRYEPLSPMASRTIGSIDLKSGKGRVGVEASFDKQLSGVNGMQLVEKVGNGVVIPVGGIEKKPEPGLDVYMTLDMNIQDIAETSLRKSLELYQADYGCVIVMDVKTGEIRAMANLTNKNGEFKEINNYALAGGTDPGSTFKLATLLAVAEESGVDLNQEMVNTGGGKMRYKSVTITDTKRSGHGTITAQQVLEKSSNIGTVLLAHKYFGHQPQKYINYLNKYKLREQTGIHMKGEVSPYIKDPSSSGWSKVSLGFISHGYEMRMTPLQVLAFYNAIANNGYWVRPMIVKELRNASDKVEEFAPYVTSEPIASPAAIRKVQAALLGVVENGTARNIRSDLYKFAGKTGTAQRLINGQYIKGRYYTSFAGYFPAENPKYSCIVVVDSPRGFGLEKLYAGSVAAPVFKEVSDRIFAYDVALQKPLPLPELEQTRETTFTGLAHELETIAKSVGLSPIQERPDGWINGVISPGKQITWQDREIQAAKLPDVKGMALRDAMFVLENKGYKIRFKGSGKVIAQEYRANGLLKEVYLTLQ